MGSHNAHEQKSENEGRDSSSGRKAVGSRQAQPGDPDGVSSHDAPSSNSDGPIGDDAGAQQASAVGGSASERGEAASNPRDGVPGVGRGLDEDTNSGTISGFDADDGAGGATGT